MPAKRKPKAPTAINDAVETVSVTQLRAHPQNPRQGDVGAIYESIEKNGFYGVIVAQKSTGFILAGNHRWQAAMRAGLEEVPVAWVDVDDDRALRILLADNRTNDLASYDDNVLLDILKDLIHTDEELLGTGYERDDIDDLLDKLGPPTEFAEVEGEVQTHYKCPKCGHRWRGKMR